MIGLAVALAALVVLVLPVPAGAGDAPVFTHAGRWTIDRSGRVVIGTGLNLIVKGAPFRPEHFTATDAAFLANQGFTFARIGFIWEAVEPRPGVYDDAYIQKIAGLDHLLGQYGIHTLVDFHQDSYSSKYGGDGAPAWAAQDDGLCVPSIAATCGVVAASHAFQHFWDNDPAPDGVGLMDHYVRAWQHVLPFLKDSSNVIGLDVFNEPTPGIDSGCVGFAPCPPFEQQTLPAFYDRMATAIHAVDPRHLVVYEPAPEAANVSTSLPTSVTRAAQVGFSYHVYVRDCGLAPEPLTPTAVAVQRAKCGLEDAAAIDAGLDYAVRAGLPVTMGEWGDATNDVDIAQMVDLMAGRFLGWAEWSYYSTIASAAPGLLIDDTKPPSAGNVRQRRLDALVSPHPTEIAGTPRSYAFDRDGRVMTLSYSTAPAGSLRLARNAATRIFVPRRTYPAGYRVRVTGGRILSTAGSSWLVISAARGASSVKVSVRPA